MSPKEQVNAIIIKFYNLRAHEVMDAPDKKLAYSIAIESAIICVEQIIPCTWKLSTYKRQGVIDVDERTTTDYWEQVLEYIKNS